MIPEFMSPRRPLLTKQIKLSIRFHDHLHFYQQQMGGKIKHFILTACNKERIANRKTLSSETKQKDKVQEKVSRPSVEPSNNCY